MIHTVLTEKLEIDEFPFNNVYLNFCGRLHHRILAEYDCFILKPLIV